MPFSSSKILYHVDRVADWKKGKVSNPITYEIDMTNVCNNKCPFCFGFLDRKRHPLSIPLTQVKKILKQIKQFNGKAVTFTGGGDPLCNPHTIDAVKYAKSLGLDVGFITNGLLINDKTAQELVKNCLWVRISLDAATPKTYEKTHGLNGTAFDKVLTNIKELVKAKKKLKSNITIGVGFLTYDTTIDEMVPFAKLCKNLGVDYAQFRPLLKNFKDKEFNEKAHKNLISNIEKSKKLSTAAFKVESSVHKYNLISKDAQQRAYGKCYGHNFTAVIAADQKMYICCHMRGVQKYALGDLKLNTLKQIWHSDNRKKVYENINFKDCPLLCRCDSFNNILWQMSIAPMHENFL